MHTVTKIAGATVLLATVASANMYINLGDHHGNAQARFQHRLAEHRAGVDSLTTQTNAANENATTRLQALLEKTRANTEHRKVEDAARFKALDAKLASHIVKVDRDITAHDAEVALAQKGQLLATNQIHELEARLARLAKNHVSLVRDKGIAFTNRAAATKAHQGEIATLSKELANVVATKAKLEAMEKYLAGPEAQITFAELEAVMATHAAGESVAAGPFHKADIHDAAHFENKVKAVTDASRAKGTEIARMLQEFVGMLDKEMAQTQGAIKRSTDHFAKTLKVLDLKDAHIANQVRDVELDEKASSEHLAAEKTRLLDLQHKQAQLEAQLKLEHERHAELVKQRHLEAAAEDRKQHNFAHEHDVEETLLALLRDGAEVKPISTAFNAHAAQDATLASTAAQAQTQAQQLAAERERSAAAYKLAVEQAQTQREAAAAHAKAAALMRAQRQAAKEAAAVAREEARKQAEARRRAEVAAQDAAAKEARKQAAAAARAKAQADREAAQAAKRAEHQHYLQQLAEEREQEAHARNDARAAAVAAHEAAQAKVAGEEADRQKAVADAAATRAAADKAHQDQILKEHTDRMAKAQAEQAVAAAQAAQARAQALQAKQKEIVDQAQKQKDALAAKVAAVERQAATEAQAEHARREQAALAKATAQAARQKAKADAEAAARAARKAEVERRRQEAENFHAAKKAVYHQ